MSGRVGEEGHDVDEVDTRDREVGEAAQRLAQAYLCTGELGGTGGGGGGLSSRGILAGCDVGDGVGGRFLGGHCGEKEKREGEERGNRTKEGEGKRKRKVGKIGSRRKGQGKGKGIPLGWGRAKRRPGTRRRGKRSSLGGREPSTFTGRMQVADKYLPAAVRP